MDKLVDFDHLYLSSLGYIDTFEKDIDLIISDPKYPEAAQILAKVFKSFAQKTHLHLESIKKKYDSHLKTFSDIKQKPKKTTQDERKIRYKLIPSMSEHRNEVEGIYDYFKEVSGMSRYIKTASIENTPQGLLYTFQKLVNALSPKAYIFLRRQWKHNYKYGEFISQILDRDKRPEFFDYIAEEINFSLCMVSYPSLCEDNYLYNWNISHEVGHYIADLKPIFRSLDDFEKTIGLLKEIDKSSKVRERVAQVGYTWFIEFIADVYATIILGPAYLFSFLEYNETKSEKSLDDAIIEGDYPYPSTRMRLYFIIKTMEHEELNLIKLFSENKYKHEWISAINERLQSIKSVVEDDKLFQFEFDNANDKEISQLAWIINKGKANNYIKYALDIFRKTVFQKECKSETAKNIGLFDIDQIKSVHSKFIDSIPINEVADKETYNTTPLSAYLILNYGWMRSFELLKLYNKATKEENKYDLIKQLSNLKVIIKRSIEASYLHQQYKEQQELIYIK